MSRLPTVMTAIEITTPGGPEVLQPRERPVPTCGPEELLIEVAAAGVNRPDLMQRQGRYPPPPGATDIPGLEVAGTVAAVGERVSGWAIGDPVCALVVGGGYAEYCLAPAPQCLPVPSGVSMTEAAAMPETFFTVWTNLFDRGRLTHGERVLVHGGASGIGTVAVQMARAFDAVVYATAGSPSKCRAVEELGAARAINYRTEDFVEVIKHDTGGRGVDLVLDMVGAEYLSRNLDALAMDGRLVVIAVQKGARAEINLLTLMQKRLWVTGSTLRPRTVAQKGEIAVALRTHVWPLVERGRIRPVIHATFPLSGAAEAHALLESGEHVGKVVLLVASSQ